MKWNEAPPREQLRRAGMDLSEHRDFGGAWRREPIDRRMMGAVILEDGALVHGTQVLGAELQLFGVALEAVPRLPTFARFAG